MEEVKEQGRFHKKLYVWIGDMESARQRPILTSGFLKVDIY